MNFLWLNSSVLINSSGKMFNQIHVSEFDHANKAGSSPTMIPAAKEDCLSLRCTNFRAEIIKEKNCVQN